jgi:hypothetical protein
MQDRWFLLCWKGEDREWELWEDTATTESERLDALADREVS